MPDHFHLFVRGDDNFILAQWVKGLKRGISAGFPKEQRRSLWQPGFFDHVLRNDESYTEKWKYVRRNPVRASRADAWSYQGEFVVIDRA
jgi:putative transposase